MRNESHQVLLEQHGAVVIPFLMEHNVEWVLGQAAELTYQNGREPDWLAQTERLDAKLRSKVEYRCVNCEPFHYELVRLDHLTAIQGRYHTFSAVTNELRHPSLRFIVPLHKSGLSVRLRYLPRAHTVVVAPRIQGHEHDFTWLGPKMVSRMASLKVSPTKAAVLFSSVPYVIECDDSLRDALALIITVLPYEADPNVITLAGMADQRMFKMHRCRYPDYLRWCCGDETALLGMRPVFDVEIPYAFTGSDAERGLFASRENSFTFVRTLKRLLTRW